MRGFVVLRCMWVAFLLTSGSLWAAGQPATGAAQRELRLRAAQACGPLVSAASSLLSTRPGRGSVASFAVCPFAQGEGGAEIVAGEKLAALCAREFLRGQVAGNLRWRRIPWTTAVRRSTWSQAKGSKDLRAYLDGTLADERVAPPFTEVTAPPDVILAGTYRSAPATAATTHGALELRVAVLDPRGTTALVAQGSVTLDAPLVPQTWRAPARLRPLASLFDETLDDPDLGLHVRVEVVDPNRRYVVGDDVSFRLTNDSHQTVYTTLINFSADEALLLQLPNTAVPDPVRLEPGESCEFPRKDVDRWTYTIEEPTGTENEYVIACADKEPLVLGHADMAEMEGRGHTYLDAVQGLRCRFAKTLLRGLRADPARWGIGKATFEDGPKDGTSTGTGPGKRR